jgi:hypothetical protein
MVWNKFDRIRDAKPQETVRFSKFRNAVAGRIHPIRQGRENGFDLRRQSAQPGNSPLFALFLAAHRRLPRHYSLFYKGMT